MPPILTPGAGAGVGAVVGFNPGSRDDAGVMIVQTGNGPTGPSIIAALQFSEPYTSAPLSVVISPANQAAAQLGQGFAYVLSSSIASNGFQLWSTAIPLVAGTEYLWAYVLQF